MGILKDVRVLDATIKQNVGYAVPLWQRDEQIKLAIARVAGRIQPGERRAEPIAIVGYGPSLRETWEGIRPFRYIITSSGSHRFLIDRGIVPTWHAEVDPRPHKIALLGAPHPDVEYLVASTCHPDYFAHLEGFTVKLWHVFDGNEEAMRLLPHGEWAVMGGCDVGLRAMTLAAFLGFRDLHMFGLDGCAKDEDGERHAGAHPNGKQSYSRVEYAGQSYWTTPAMLEAARQTRHELEQMPAVRPTFHGAGLTQAMVADYVPKASDETFLNLIAWSKPELISAEYRALNAQLHEKNLAYGVGGGKHAEAVLKIASHPDIKSILDYGCGKGYLAKAIPFPIWEYDPAIPGKDESPKPADLVVCTDVLEHIEPEKLAFVLADLRRCVKRVGYFVIYTEPAQKTLPDGRNTHLIQKDAMWWSKQLHQYFAVGKMVQRGPALYVIVAPKVQQAKKKKKAVA